jgi:LDH2 family malate/lactate/ureidoglycolate dehydrogenase
MRTARAEELKRFAAAVFVAHGTPPSDASLVAEALVKASLLGHDSHGILRVARYIDKIRQHTLDPGAQPSIAKQYGATAVVDGGLGFGQVSAAFGTDLVIKLAREHGIATVSLSRTNHVGRLGDYAERIASEGLIGVVIAAGAGPGGSVAAHGGRERIFGTNPLAWGLPVPAGRGPLVADFSTSAIPEGKVGMAQATNSALPSGVAIDKHGKPTTDPAGFYDGGALLPFGGHKGYSLVLFIEVVANLLAGTVPVSSAEYRPGNPAVLIAIKVESFLDPDEYLRHTCDLLARIESSAPADGFERVLVPNAIELGIATQRARDGVPVPAAIWSELEVLGSAAGIPPLTTT